MDEGEFRKCFNKIVVHMREGDLFYCGGKKMEENVHGEGRGVMWHE